MPNPLEHLSEADLHIAEAEVVVHRQRQKVERLAGEGRDTTKAEQKLQSMVRILDRMHAYRRLIAGAVPLRLN